MLNEGSSGWKGVTGYVPEVGKQEVGMKLKRTTLVRQGDVLGCGAGVTRGMFRKAVENELLNPVIIKGYRNPLFRRAEVVKVFALEEDDGRD